MQYILTTSSNSTHSHVITNCEDIFTLRLGSTNSDVAGLNLKSIVAPLRSACDGVPTTPRIVTLARGGQLAAYPYGTMKLYMPKNLFSSTLYIVI